MYELQHDSDDTHSPSDPVTTLQHTFLLQHTATHIYELQRDTDDIHSPSDPVSTLKPTHLLKRTATHCNALQRIATRCNTHLLTATRHYITH